MTTFRLFLTSLCALLLSSLVLAADPALVGTWVAREDGEEVSRMTFNANGSANMDGSPVQYQASGGSLQFSSSGITFDAAYRVSGNQLSLTLFDETIVYQRVGAPPAPAPSGGGTGSTGGNPLGGARSSNPLGRGQAAPPAHPAVGTWSDGSLTLRLEGSANSLTGTLTLGGQAFPVTASAAADQISGTFQVQDQSFPFAAQVSGTQMALESEGNRYALHKEGGVANPLGVSTPGGVTPPDGNRFKRPEDGFDLPLPGDFRVLGNENGAFLLGSDVTPGMFIVMPNPALTEAEFQQELSQGFTDENVQLSAKGTPRNAKVQGGTGKVADVQGSFQGTVTTGMVGAFFHPGQGGVVVLALTTPEMWPQLKPFADQMFAGVRLSAPVESAELQQARQMLAGKSLVDATNQSTTTNTGGYIGGTSVHSFRAWHCCADGTGRFEGARSTSFNSPVVIGGSESGPGVHDGRWNLTSAGGQYHLVFTFQDGSTASWPISMDASGEVYVDGKRVKVTEDSICGG